MYRRILVALDGSAPSFHALHEAIHLAAGHDVELRLIHVVDIRSLYWGDTTIPNVSDVEEAWCEEARDILARGEATARDAGLEVDSVLRETNGGRVTDKIVAEAENWPADLIVAGTHGRHGIGHLLLGSIAEGIARSATVPLLLVRGPMRATAPAQPA